MLQSHHSLLGRCHLCWISRLVWGLHHSPAHHINSAWICKLYQQSHDIPDLMQTQRVTVQYAVCSSGGNELLMIRSLHLIIQSSCLQYIWDLGVDGVLDSGSTLYWNGGVMQDQDPGESFSPLKSAHWVKNLVIWLKRAWKWGTIATLTECCSEKMLIWHVLKKNKMSSDNQLCLCCDKNDDLKSRKAEKRHK